MKWGRFHLFFYLDTLHVGGGINHPSVGHFRV